MPSQGTYLSPGFCLTLSASRNKFIFSQLEGMLKRATPNRLKIIDALNQGFDGDFDELARALHADFGIPRNATRTFLEVLDRDGYLSATAPKPHDDTEHPIAATEVSSTEVIIGTPLSFIAESGHYCLYSHEGKLLLRLTLAELPVVALFVEPISIAAAKTQFFAQEDTPKITPEHFDTLIGRFAGAGLFAEPLDEEELDKETELFATVDPAALHALIDKRVAAHDEAVAREGKELVQVVPVNTVYGTTPLSLGMVIAYAMDYEGGRLQDRYDFIPMFLADEARLLARADRPGVYLFSNYVWNFEENLALSEAVKKANPSSIIIHGGPNTPSYEQECEEFFAKHTHVDIAVRGEGELTLTEILDALDVGESTDLEALRPVPGLTYRSGEGVYRTADRERIPDLDTIPSPYLKGLFDEFAVVRAGAIIESNRGCPYGCTFCDWGSATLSKVRRFSLDRVFKELEWSATHRVEAASMADANFGMLERDVEITQKIADLRQQYGYPNMVSVNYAKNQVRYLRDIIRILAEVGILAEGTLSFQSRDEATLKVIDRSNIKLSKYNELAAEFRKAKLPMGVELMMGLPGSTMQSFRNDLQDCTDRDLRVQAAPTQLLPNSPMNAPSYREEHGIIAKSGEYVKQTATYTREDWEQMMLLRTAYFILDTYGVARYVARYVRGESGMLEIDFYDKLRIEASSNPAKYPVMARALKTLEDYMAPPGSWSFFIEELRHFVVDQLGLADDSGLRTALAVQLAHLPAAYRHFPMVLELEHDFVTWWDTILEIRDDGHRTDWEKHVPRLSEYGPASMTITDPNKICDMEIGKSLGAMNYTLRTWELDSPVARVRNLMAIRQG